MRGLDATVQSGSIGCVSGLQKIEQFLRDEDGAATVDWIVDSAMAAGLSVATMGAVPSGISNLVQSISSAISSKTVSNGDAEG